MRIPLTILLYCASVIQAFAQTPATVKASSLSSTQLRLQRVRQVDTDEEVWSYWSRFCGNAQTLATSDCGSVRLWDLKTGTPKNVITIPPDAESDCEVFSLAQSQDGTLIATGNKKGKVTVRNAKTGQVQHTYQGPFEHEVMALTFSTDGQLLVSGGLAWDICVWNLRNHEKVVEFKGTRPITSVALSRNSELLAFGSTATNFEVFDLKTGKATRAINEQTTTSKDGHKVGGLIVCFSHQGDFLATADNEGTVKIWDVRTGICMTLVGHGDDVTSLLFSPDDQYLASSSQGRICLWRTRSGKRISDQKVKSKHVGLVAFSPDSKKLISIEENGLVGFWQLGASD